MSEKVAKVKELSEFEWVRLAASTDEARPVLTGSCARNGHLVATDGHRLHIAPNSGAVAHGLWSGRSLRKIEGTFPNTDAVIPKAQRRYQVRDVAGLLRLARAGNAIQRVFKSWSHGRLVLPAVEGRVLVSAHYITDILVGALDLQIEIGVGGPMTPIRFDLGGERLAVVMPIRAEAGATDFAADDFLVEIEEPKAEEKPKRQRKAKEPAA